MSNFSYNTNPEQLTSFESISSPENRPTLFRSLLDFVRPNQSIPAGESSTTNGASTSQNVVAVRKVTTFESMFNKPTVKTDSKNVVLDQIEGDLSSEDFKKYWMPDDQCKECYECGAVFSTFRRKHHCRLCGQIFCYDCCSDMISGKISGYRDTEVQIRVCKYCLELKSKNQQIERRTSATKGLIFSPNLDRNEPELTNTDHCNEFLQEELQDEDVWKINLHFMWSLFRSPESSVPPQQLWHRFRHISNAYLLDDIMSWLGEHLPKSENPELMLNDWIETERLEPIDVNKTMFRVGPKDDFNENTVLLYEQIKKEPEDSSANWIHRLIQEAKASSQTFDLHYAVNISSYVHVDINKDLDDEYWHKSSEATLNTSESLDDTIGHEISRLVDSLNKTCTAIKELEAYDANQSAEGHGMEVVDRSMRQEKVPNPSLFLPKYGETSDPVPVDKIPEQEVTLNTLSNIYENHMNSILDMLIDKERIPSEWKAILHRLISEAASDVTPNPMTGDSMDVRKYVKIKKIYGKPKDSKILDGYVFSKTIAHKKMKSNIQNPKIMFLNGSISYQRVLNKLTSLNPVFLQEREYLNKVVDRIASFQPDILVVEKSVSQIAKNELLNKGITLILNLKPNQLDKIARVVQGDIIQNLDNVNFIPATKDLNSSSGNTLGYSKEFYCEFAKGFHGPKSLLYFTGCNKSLGKTIILRDENKHVLRRVKKVALYYLYALYNRRLEYHYLKRSRIRCNNLLHVRELKYSESAVSEAGTFTPKPGSYQDDTLGVDMVPVGASPSDRTPDYDDISETSRSVGLCSNSKHRVFEDLTHTAIFSVTPFVRPSVPYLMTKEGCECPSRHYFDDEVYYSNLLSPKSEIGEDPLLNTVKNIASNKNCCATSPTKPIVTSITPDDMAFFRAFGYWEFEHTAHNKRQKSESGDECHPEAPNHIQNRFEQSMKGKELDCLDFYHHQKLLVLFTSLSTQSLNHPHPCISPWSLNMQFYGKNDLTLGLFLRDYCFQSSYECPDQQCKTDIVNHERRFIHNGQCVNMKMGKLTTVLEELINTPIMWSVCSQCLFVSHITIVSKETWNYSFAKFLELKFYENSLLANGQCPHPFHRYHINFFALGNIVACFKRSDVFIQEVCPLVTRYSFQDKFTDIAVANGVLLNETVTKINSAIKVIQEKINALSGVEESVISDASSKLTNEESVLKQELSEISSEIELSPINQAIQIRRSIYRVQSQLVFSIDSWNKYLYDVLKGRLYKKKIPAAVRTISQTNCSSTDMLHSEDEHCGTSPMQKSMNSERGKSHRRVLSDSYLHVVHKLDKKIHSQSLDDNMFLKRTCSEEVNDEEVNDEKNMKQSEMRLYSKVASKTKQFFTALTESFKKIELPFPHEEHHRITGGSTPSVLVNERHFTSIIAYAMSCEQYRAKLQLLKPEMRAADITGDGVKLPTYHRPSPVNYTFEPDTDKSGHWMTVNNSNDHMDMKQASHRRQKSVDVVTDEGVTHRSSHVDVEFHDGPTKFFSKIYFAAEFEKLRHLVMPGEAVHDFVHSLSMCNKWKAKGGRSGLAFSKTQDDRWVIKEMSRLELQALLIFMPNYVEYVIDSINQQRPTLLAKIVGAFTVGFNNNHSGVSMKQDVIIMENIFYGVSPSVTYDLKGSVRNRLAEEGEEVLLDENFLYNIVDNPIYLRPHCKTFLREAVNCDAAFLAAQSVIDYSLLVGMCGDMIVIGIIDYIRKFTFDKKVEMIFKSKMIGSAGRMPTIVSPEMYRERFCNQIERYFPLVPDKWTGMGSDLYYS